MKEKFVNPYNFIKFPEEKAQAYTEEDRHTGVIEYSITTKTPLFIPNSSSEKAFKATDNAQEPEHKSYDFFSYTELNEEERYDGNYHVPVIPGSEMRGVVRNVYETLTDSCMGLLNEVTQVISRQLNVNIRKLTIETEDGIFEGKIQLWVHDVDDVKTICNNLKKIQNIKQVSRVEE